MVSLYQLTRRSYQAQSFCTALHFCLQLTEWHKQSHTVLNPLFWIYIIILLFWHPIIWRRLVSPRLYRTRREEMWWTRTGFKHRALHGTSLQYNALIAIRHQQLIISKFNSLKQSMFLYLEDIPVPGPLFQIWEQDRSWISNVTEGKK